MGPLSGYKFVEMAGLGPAPFCGMMLADMGADVIRIARKRGSGKPLVDEAYDILNRGRATLELDLKNSDDKETLRGLIARADGLIEGYRPGVMERLGFGPDECLQINQGLVFGRITGWGQNGPLAQRAGHDINYLGLSGALSAIGRKDSAPVPPLNMVADFGGGGMLLLVGMLSALLERKNSGRGQVVDAAMVDGCALQLSLILSLKNMGAWSAKRQDNMLDGGAPFYDTYECADGQFIAVGAIEAEFYQTLLRVCEIDDEVMNDQWNKSLWPIQKAIIEKTFRSKTRDAWAAIFQDCDACVSPVLSLDEAPANEHNRIRGTYAKRNGMLEPNAAPRFSRTASSAGLEVDRAQDLLRSKLDTWGLGQDFISRSWIG